MIVPAAPRVVMTSGVWSLLHRGHLNLLWRASRLGDYLVVGVVSDEGTAAYKGRRPVDGVETRIRNVAALGIADAVLYQATTDPSPLLERFLPDTFVHADEPGWQRLREGHDTLDRLGIEYVLLPYTPGISTTALRLCEAGCP